MVRTLEQAATWKQLSALWANRALPTLPTKGHRYAILSDLHLGDGGKSDDFAPNEMHLLYALDYYLQKGYELILLGDTEEFWQFDLPSIVRRYGETVYASIRCYGEGRVHRVYGNHDIEWGGMADPARFGSHQPALASEALRLLGPDGTTAILLTHGHQGSLRADKYAWFSRFFVHLFKGIEPLALMIGLYRRGAVTKSRLARNFGRMMYAWARDHRALLICGHSHRPIFASHSTAEMLGHQIDELGARSAAAVREGKVPFDHQMEILHLRGELIRETLNLRAVLPMVPEHMPLPCYFNTGCCLYNDGLTAIEIADGSISLVRWGPDAAGPKKGPAIVRHLYDTADLAELIARVRGEDQAAEDLDKETLLR